MKRAFTLVEVTLAMGIMSVGVLSLVGLYSYGYREANQSRQDVGATALADIVLAQLAAAASATNVTWSAFKSLGNYPDDSGWGYFVDENTGRIKGDPTGRARSDFSKFISDLGVQGEGFQFPSLPNNMNCGLVIQHEQGKQVVRFGFRLMTHKSELLSAPLFYTEAKFMGGGQ